MREPSNARTRDFAWRSVSKGAGSSDLPEIGNGALVVVLLFKSVAAVGIGEGIFRINLDGLVIVSNRPSTSPFLR